MGEIDGAPMVIGLKIGEKAMWLVKVKRFNGGKRFLAYALDPPKKINPIQGLKCSVTEIWSRKSELLDIKNLMRVKHGINMASVMVPLLMPYSTPRMAWWIQAIMSVILLDWHQVRGVRCRVECGIRCDAIPDATPDTHRVFKFYMFDFCISFP